MLTTCYTLHSTALVRMTISAVFFHSHKSERKATDCYEDNFWTVTCLYAMQAASKALKEREAALLTLHAIEADLEKRRHTIVAIEEEGQKVSWWFLYLIPSSWIQFPRMHIILRVHRCMGM